MEKSLYGNLFNGCNKYMGMYYHDIIYCLWNIIRNIHIFRL